MSNQGAPNGLEITESVLKRIADIYNGIARAALVTTNFSCLTRFVDYPNGSLELWVEHSHSSLAEGSLWPEGTPEPVYMAAMSYNRCVTAVEMCSGILAFLTKGLDMTIVEVDFLHPRPHRETLLWFKEHSSNSDQLELFQNSGNCAHTIMKLFPDRVCVEDLDKMQTGLILDPTHRQYGYESAVDTFEAYLEHKTEQTEDDYGPVTQKALGRCYWEHRDKLDEIGPEGEAKTQFDRFFLQATIMTINNSVHKSLRHFGGPKALLRKIDVDFEAAQHQIMTSLQIQLMDLRAEMDHTIFSQGDFSYEDLEGMVQGCHGVGHTECEAALLKIWEEEDDDQI